MAVASRAAATKVLALRVADLPPRGPLWGGRGGADPPLVGTGSMAASGAATTTGLASSAVDPSLAGHVIGNNNDFGFGWVRSTTASYGSDGDNNGALWSNGSGGREVRDSVDKVSDAMDVDTLLLLLT